MQFPDQYLEQAIRYKLTFSCSDESSKSKLYDAGASITLDRTIEILYQRETTKFELQESKSARIDSVRDRPRNKSKVNRYANRKVDTPEADNKCGYCNLTHPFGIRNCPAARANCTKCKRKGHYAIVCRSAQTHTKSRVSRVGIKDLEDLNDDDDDDSGPSFIGSVTDKGSPETQIYKMRDLGWYINLKVKDDMLQWHIDSGAEVTVMADDIYKESYGELRPSDRNLMGAGNTSLTTIGCTKMKLNSCSASIEETVYVIRGTKQLLLGQPAIRSFGLISEIPGAYSIRAIKSKMSPPEPVGKKKFQSTEDVKKAYPKLFSGLGMLTGEYDIKLRDDAKPFCLYTPRRVPLPLMKKVKI